MSYIPFEIRVLPIFFFYIGLSVFGILITIKMFSNYFRKKNIAMLYLSLVFMALTLAVIVLALGLLEGIITGYYKEIYMFSLPCANCMVIIADIFLYKFVNYLTDKGKNAFVPLVLIGVVLGIILFLPWNWWGVPHEDYVGQPDIRLFSILSLVVYSYIVYLSIIIICQRSKSYSANRINRIQLSLFSWSIVSLVFFYLMMIFDTLLVVLYYHPGYSIFFYFAWIFAWIFFILSYLSLFVPKEEFQEVLEMIAKYKRRKLTEEEILYHKEKKICLVCKDKISRRKKFICFNCDILYCVRCSNALSNLENFCWVCETPIDPSKPVKISETTEELEIKMSEKPQKKPKD